MIKYCKFASCGKELKRKANERPRDFKRRDHCNKKCCDSAKRQPVTIRYCPVCSGEIPRKPGWSPAIYAVIATCGKPKCVYERQAHIHRGKRGTYNVTPKPKPIKLPKRTPDYHTSIQRNWMEVYYPHMVKQHETIILEPDTKWEEIKKCKSCNEEDGNYRTGLCSRCALAEKKSRPSNWGYKYL